MRNINNEPNIGWVNAPNSDGFARMSRNGESFYVRNCIKDINSNYYFGIVDNNLMINNDLKYGEKIKFKPTP